MKGELNYREVIYRIGNMMLLRDRVNKSVSNLNFDKKLSKYEAQNKKSKMPLPTLSKNVLSYKIWSQEAVLVRSKEIAEIATEVWSAKSTTMKGKAKEVKKKRKRRKNSSKSARSKRTRG
jgi:hypothetical protein